MKTCTRCGETKSLDDFGSFKRSLDGYKPWCKYCTKVYNKQYRQSNLEKLKAKHLEYCRENREKRLGYDKERYKKNREELIAYQKFYRVEKRKQISAYKKQYYRDNKTAIQEKVRKRRTLSPEKIASQNARYRAKKRQATPSWLTEDHLKEIDTFYWLARDLRVTTGENYEVDHIVPLTSNIVCGLHVPWNLQILPSDINSSKRNKLQE